MVAHVRLGVLVDVHGGHRGADADHAAGHRAVQNPHARVVAGLDQHVVAGFDRGGSGVVVQAADEGSRLGPQAQRRHGPADGGHTRSADAQSPTHQFFPCLGPDRHVLVGADLGPGGDVGFGGQVRRGHVDAGSHTGDSRTARGSGHTQVIVRADGRNADRLARLGLARLVQQSAGFHSGPGRASQHLDARRQRHGDHAGSLGRHGPLSDLIVAGGGDQDAVELGLLRAGVPEHVSAQARDRVQGAQLLQQLGTGAGRVRPLGLRRGLQTQPLAGAACRRERDGQPLLGRLAAGRQPDPRGMIGHGQRVVHASVLQPADRRVIRARAVHQRLADPVPVAILQIDRAGVQHDVLGAEADRCGDVHRVGDRRRQALAGSQGDHRGAGMDRRGGVPGDHGDGHPDSDRGRGRAARAAGHQIGPVVVGRGHLDGPLGLRSGPGSQPSLSGNQLGIGPHGSGDADRAARARGGRHRDDLARRFGADAEIARGRQRCKRVGRAVADIGLGLLADHADVDARADSRRAAAGSRACDSGHERAIGRVDVDLPRRERRRRRDVRPAVLLQRLDRHGSGHAHRAGSLARDRDVHSGHIRSRGHRHALDLVACEGRVALAGAVGFHSQIRPQPGFRRVGRDQVRVGDADRGGSGPAAIAGDQYQRTDRMPGIDGHVAVGMDRLGRLRPDPGLGRHGQHGDQDRALDGDLLAARRADGGCHHAGRRPGPHLDIAPLGRHVGIVDVRPCRIAVLGTDHSGPDRQFSPFHPAGNVDDGRVLGRVYMDPAALGRDCRVAGDVSVGDTGQRQHRNRAAQGEILSAGARNHHRPDRVLERGPDLDVAVPRGRERRAVDGRGHMVFDQIRGHRRADPGVGPGISQRAGDGPDSGSIPSQHLDAGLGLQRRVGNMGVDVHGDPVHGDRAGSGEGRPRTGPGGDGDADQLPVGAVQRQGQRVAGKVELPRPH